VPFPDRDLAHLDQPISAQSGFLTDDSLYPMFGLQFGRSRDALRSCF
jgi:hypothetical protein